MQQAHYDYIVIGGGSGGIASARRAAAYGARTLLVESGRLGGTCVNVGCVPKKVMWNAAHLRDAMDLAGDYGFTLGSPRFDWSELKRRRDAYIERLNGIYQRNLENSGVELVEGYARFTGPGSIEVDGRQFSGRHCLVATGGRPWVPDIPGADLGITSDGFFELEQLPRRVLIVGAGYIAAELAGVLNSLGSEVTLLLRKFHLLRTFDEMLSTTLTEQMTASGVEVRTGLQLSGLELNNDASIAASLSDGSHCGHFDTVIWAIGRLPNTGGLGLEQVGIETDPAGFVPVDGYQNTVVRGIHAVGDVTGAAQLTPVAIAAGRRLADRLFDGQADARLDASLVPTVIFSHPPIGTVGLSEQQAIDLHGEADLKIYTSQFTNMLYSVSAEKPPTRMKLICQGADEKVVGCHIIGEGADEMLQGFAVAMRMGATKQDFDRTIAIHPTAAEELVTMT